MSTPVEGGFEGLYDTVHRTRLANYVTLSCVVFLVYDILINLDREIPLIWRYYPKTSNDKHISWRGRGRRVPVQTLFIFGRYYAPLYLVVFFTVNNHQGLSISLYASTGANLADTNYFILKAARFTTTALFCGFPPFTTLYSLADFVASGGELLYSTLVNVILMIRLNAVYQVFHGTEGLRKHKVFLASVVIIEFLVEFSVCVAMATWTEKREIEPLAGIPGPGCVISEYPNTVLTLPAWIIAILVATIFLAGTLRLLYSSTKSRFKCFADFTLSNIREEIRNIQPITRVLVKDNVLFFHP